MNDLFHKIAVKISNAMGTPLAFLTSLAIIILWSISGPVFNFSDTWQLIINTATTIVTFLMVFLIQNTQNRDAKSVQLKLNELIKATRAARNEMIDLDELTDEELVSLQEDFRRLHEISTHPAAHKLHQKIVSEKERRSAAKRPIPKP